MGLPSPWPGLPSTAGLGGSLPRRPPCRQRASWYFYARQTNELFSLVARLLDPTALHDVGGRVRRRSAEASTWSEELTRQVIGKAEMKSTDLRPVAPSPAIVTTRGCCRLFWKPRNCNKHQALCKPQNPLEEEMREVKPRYIAVAIQDTQLNWMSLCHFSSWLWAAGR